MIFIMVSSSFAFGFKGSDKGESSENGELEESVLYYIDPSTNEFEMSSNLSSVPFISDDKRENDIVGYFVLDGRVYIGAVEMSSGSAEIACRYTDAGDWLLEEMNVCFILTSDMKTLHDFSDENADYIQLEKPLFESEQKIFVAYASYELEEIEDINSFVEEFRENYITDVALGGLFDPTEIEGPSSEGDDIVNESPSTEAVSTEAPVPESTTSDIQVDYGWSEEPGPS